MKKMTYKWRRYDFRQGSVFNGSEDVYIRNMPHGIPVVPVIQCPYFHILPGKEHRCCTLMEIRCRGADVWPVIYPLFRFSIDLYFKAVFIIRYPQPFYGYKKVPGNMDLILLNIYGYCFSGCFYFYDLVA